MSHRHAPPPADDEPTAGQDPASPAHSSGHGGWGMAGMMLLCCIPMIILIALAVASSR